MIARCTGIVVLTALLLSRPGQAAPAGADASNEGRADYLRYCAACHGVEADGHGAVAPVLRTTPSDLRTLSARYGTPLPSDQVARFIDGREAVTAHGEREMPVWGERFNTTDTEGNRQDAAVRRRIARLLAYLASIQTPHAP